MVLRGRAAYILIPPGVRMPPMPNGLVQLVERIPNSTVVLVGDVMLDRYVFGSADRVSPEAPVPVLHFQHEQRRLGGAGSVLADLAMLGARVRVLSVIGKDESGAEVRRRMVEECHADVSGVIETDDRPTVTKLRLLGAASHRQPQQMIRLDTESNRPIGGEIERRLLDRAAAALDGAAVLCIEDYNKGLLTADFTSKLIELARGRGVPVIIDPAYIPDYTKYRGATALKLNRPEAERATGLPLREPDHYARAAELLLGKLSLEAVIVTLNELGAYLATNDGLRQHLRSRPREVFDATGAGDVVLAMLCMARSGGASWSDAVAIANIAGGLEVEKLGCVPITRQEIIADLLSDSRQRDGKLRNLQQLLPELERHRAMGRKIVFTNGCFDLIHLGHVEYFRFAKRQGDILIVAVNTDSSIRRLKGPKRPIINEDDRTSVLEELESIDYVILFDDDTPIPLLNSIKPDVLVKGADYSKQEVVGWEVVESYGGRIALAPLVDGRSTSSLIERIIEAYR